MENRKNKLKRKCGIQNIGIAGKIRLLLKKERKIPGKKK